MTYPPSRLVRVGLFALLAPSLISVDLTLAADETPKIEWRQDLASAQAEARSRDLLLWMQFTGPWCINCRRMDRATFVHTGVVARSRDQFVPIKLRSDEYEALALNLGLTSLPSTVIVRPNGEIVEKYEGFVEPDTFDVTLREVLRRENRLPEQIAARKKKQDQDRAIALAGYCPVSLLNQQRLVPGRPELAVEHDGRVFRFASAAEKQTFRTRPDVFAPANDGLCPVSQVERGDLHPGDPRWGVVYNGHLYLFKDAIERDRFVKDPERYANLDLADRTTCPHCWTRTRTASRNPSRFTTSQPTSSASLPATDRIEAMLAPSSTIRR